MEVFLKLVWNKGNEFITLTIREFIRFWRTDNNTTFNTQRKWQLCMAGKGSGTYRVCPTEISNVPVCVCVFPVLSPTPLNFILTFTLCLLTFTGSRWPVWNNRSHILAALASHANSCKEGDAIGTSLVHTVCKGQHLFTSCLDTDTVKISWSGPLMLANIYTMRFLLHFLDYIWFNFIVTVLYWDKEMQLCSILPEYAREAV